MNQAIESDQLSDKYLDKKSYLPVELKRDTHSFTLNMQVDGIDFEKQVGFSDPNDRTEGVKDQIMQLPPAAARYKTLEQKVAEKFLNYNEAWKNSITLS
ncbi:MAG: hypothetical protein R3A13_09085 [Bdellovibrionota bacterium]